MEHRSRSNFVLTAISGLLGLYSLFLTIGLWQVKQKAEQLASRQSAELAAAQHKVEQVLRYVETFHGDDDTQRKDLARIKIVMAEHEQKLFLLQDTIDKLYSLDD
jgi:cell division protein FtsB